MPNPTVPLPGNADVMTQPLISRGDQGEAVRTIQQRLQIMGFYRGVIDGDYGRLTEEAVAAFQKANRLQVTGGIDALTLRCLGLEVGTSKPPQPGFQPLPSTGPITAATLKRMFPDAPLQNIDRYFPYVLQALAQFNLNDPVMILMALATIRAETSSFAPISEYQSKYNTSPGSAPFDLYDFRSDLGNRGKGDGARFKGRGFI
ncbi:MAG TPA: peptidoglycan-binding protein, partial [Oculatellaceae cyanobacterium]